MTTAEAVYVRASLSHELRVEAAITNHSQTKIRLEEMARYAEQMEAELGRGAGEPVAWQIDDKGYQWVVEELRDAEICRTSGHKVTPLFTRPPVAGPAELTDARVITDEVALVACYAMTNYAKENGLNPDGWEDYSANEKKHCMAATKAALKAASEFLGKVDG